MELSFQSRAPPAPICRRASAKFAGRQKVHVSNKFGFTKYTKKDRSATEMVCQRGMVGGYVYV